MILDHSRIVRAAKPNKNHSGSSLPKETAYFVLDSTEHGYFIDKNNEILQSWHFGAIQQFDGWLCENRCWDSALGEVMIDPNLLVDEGL